MSKKLKISIGITSGILVLMIGLLFLVNVVYEPEPEKLIYPTGELSDSIFVGQNNEYHENPLLEKMHAFSTVPYDVDVPECKGATIGTGCVYQVRDDLFVYVTEFDDMTLVDDPAKYDKTVQMQDIIASQFPQALLVNYIPEETKVTAEVSAKGFINGFTAQYLADSVGITDGARLMNSAVLGYILDIKDKGFEGKHLYISAGTTNLTNASLQECASLLSAVIKTARRNEIRYKDMTEGMVLSDEEEAEGESLEETAYVSENAGRDNGGDDVYEQYLTLDTDGAQIQVDVSWERANPDAILELFLPGGNEFCEPLVYDDYSAQFVLTNAPAGEYCLRIKNYEACGEIYDNMNDSDDGYYSDTQWCDTSSDEGCDGGADDYGAIGDGSSSSDSGISYIGGQD